MKQLTILCTFFSIIVGIIALSISMPIKSSGTSVIYVSSRDGKNGGKPLTIKVSDLNLNQQKLLNFAYEVAKSDGFHHPAYLQGIILQESRACSIKNFRVAGLTNRPGDRYFGCGQIKLSAAKAVMRSYPEMWKFLESRTDEELQARLILDDQFNIRVSSKYMLLMGINKNPERAITAYNVGPGGVNNISDLSRFNYTIRVKRFTAKMVERKKNLHLVEENIQLLDKQQIILASDP